MKIPENISLYNAQSIVLRRIEFGDYDYIITLLTRNKGKISVIAKNAKKSVKRFSGNLELFYGLDTVIRDNRRSLLLQEATIDNPHEAIRANILKTAYASYWAEIIVQWLEDGIEQEGVYELMKYVLEGLCSDNNTPEELSIMFQLKFLDIAGFSPFLTRCQVCENGLDQIEDVKFFFDIKKGGLLCSRCGGNSLSDISLVKGTIKQLIWLQESGLDRWSMMRLSKQAVEEGTVFFETFLPFHLEKELRSLKFLKRIRVRTY